MGVFQSDRPAQDFRPRHRVCTRCKCQAWHPASDFHARSRPFADEPRTQHAFRPGNCLRALKTTARRLPRAPNRSMSSHSTKSGGLGRCTVYGNQEIVQSTGCNSGACPPRGVLLSSVCSALERPEGTKPANQVKRMDGFLLFVPLYPGYPLDVPFFILHVGEEIALAYQQSRQTLCDARAP